MESQQNRPNLNTYWVNPGKLLAGEYPGSGDIDEARKRINRYLDVGITFFVDLTQAYEPLEPYDKILQQEASARGLTAAHRRMSIVDMHVPKSTQDMRDILDTIDTAIAAGHTVYVHCWGGIGRTGTVVGCYLARHGMNGNKALAEIARLWKNVEKRIYYPQSPQTREQFKYVRRWKEPSIKPGSYRVDGANF